MQEEENKMDILSELGDTISRIEKNQKSINKDILLLKDLFQSLWNPENQPIIPSNNIIDAKLSATMKFAIKMSEGPLEPERFIDFLMKGAFGKPKPGILPVVRQYTEDVHGFRKQLLEVKNISNECHNTYKKEQRYLDEKLIKRIDRLNKNILKEYNAERKNKGKQTTLKRFYVVRKPSKDDNCNDKSNSSTQDLE